MPLQYMHKYSTLFLMASGIHIWARLLLRSGQLTQVTQRVIRIQGSINFFASTRISGPDGPLILVTYAFNLLQGLTASLTDIIIINVDND